MLPEEKFKLREILTENRLFNLGTSAQFKKESTIVITPATTGETTYLPYCIVCDDRIL